MKIQEEKMTIKEKVLQIVKNNLGGTDDTRLNQQCLSKVKKQTEWEEKGKIFPFGTYPAKLINFDIRPGKTCLLVSLEFEVDTEDGKISIFHAYPLCKPCTDSLFIDHQFRGTVYVSSMLDALNIPRSGLNFPARLSLAIGVKSQVVVEQREFDNTVWNVIADWKL